MKDQQFPWDWTLEGQPFTKDKGKVFSCFACGGGSTMGYKLAGFDVIGCNEIDHRMMAAYKANHSPRYAYNEPIQEFKLREDLPRELYELDILDGSPPCSSFSMSGNREKDWGEEKVFREGQAEQVLDTLFFDFIDLAEKLKPKVVIAENVRGLILGSAQRYVDKILKSFDAAGYYVGFQLLNACRMGVPQHRERVFFYGIRKSLYTGLFADLFDSEPVLDLGFNERQILFGEFKDEHGVDENITPWVKERLDNMIPSDKSLSDINERLHGKVSGFNLQLVGDDELFPCLDATAPFFRKSDSLQCTTADYSRAGTFPSDYDFCGNKPKYIIGMSVPPVMIAKIATRVYDQWLVPYGDESRIEFAEEPCPKCGRFGKYDTCLSGNCMSTSMETQTH